MSEDPRDKKTGRFVPGRSGNPSGLKKEPEPKADAAPPDAPRGDGWHSALTGIGDPNRDKRLSHHFHARSLTYQEIIELWRGDDLAARAVESVPAECFRQGYEIVIGDEGKHDNLKELVEAAALDLRVDHVVERAMQFERAYGGSAILMGTGDSTDLSKPVNPKSVKSLDWLTVLEPIEIYPLTFYTDPQEPKFGEPETYQLAQYTQAGFSQGIIGDRAAPQTDKNVIHESRLIVFGGVRVSRYQHHAGSANTIGRLWGDGILVRLVDVLRDFNLAYQSAGIIVTDFSQSVIAIKNLMALVAKNPKALQDRMAAMELGRSTARAVLIDVEEKFSRESTSVAGLSDLLDRLATRLAAAIDMPLTLLMGQSPKGLGNEGESDVRFYYDRIQSIQRRKVAPILHQLYEVIMRSAGKKIPEKWNIRFNPPWQLTDQEKAEARLTQARADSMYVKSGVLYEDEVRNSRFGGEYSWETQIDESKKAPGPIVGPGFGPVYAAPGPQGTTRVPPTTPGGGAPPAGGVPKPPTPNHHVVGGYARRNPTKKTALPATPEGGDAPPKDSRDEALIDEAVRYRRDTMAIFARAETGGHVTPELAASRDELLRRCDELLARQGEEYVHQDYVTHEGSKWIVHSETGKRLGEYDTEGEANERLRQIEAAKAAKADAYVVQPMYDKSGATHWQLWTEDGTVVSNHATEEEAAAALKARMAGRREEVRGTTSGY